MGERLWYCTRQRAGPLVKECRALRPRLSADDTPWERREKNKILVPQRDSAVCHSTVDRLELRLALFGFEGCCYTLTFDDDHLPLKFRDARAAARNFWVKLQRWNGGKAFDRVSLIEGKHGDRRYHLHAVLRYGQFPPALIQHLWTAGFVDDEPLLRGTADSYRRMARYYTKESTDGIIIPTGSRPWTSSRTLTRQLPPPKKWMSTSGNIRIPKDAYACGRNQVQNEFGVYNYAWYIEKAPGNSFL